MRIRRFVVWSLAVMAGAAVAAGQGSRPATGPHVAATGPAVVLTGGHETDPRDMGRPVVLVASALGVPPEVFREAFSHVKPAAAGEQPDPRQVQLNKQALLSALSKYGVTNERLDEVSNYYRYPPGAAGRGEENIWKHVNAEISAIVTDGKVTGFNIKNAGAGYTTPPAASVAGFADLKIKVTLLFTTDLKTNGSVKAVEIVPAATERK